MDVEKVLQHMAKTPGIAMHINTMYHLITNINSTAGLTVLRSLLDDRLNLGLKDRVRIKQFKAVLLSGLDQSRSTVQSQMIDTTLLSSIMQEIVKRNISVNEEFYITVLKYVAVRGAPDEVVRLMSEFGKLFTDPNYREYKREVFDEVIAISSSIDNAEAVLEAMPQVLGIKPTRSTLSTIHHLCVLHKNLAKAEMYKEQIQEHDANDPYYTIRKR
ncbi:hypothetical protein SARC_11677 [Sphaeroforma arctica JP610]|uniref:Pentacotripeptide-repeat region of PRORP domain-containing protein n=1 Tax=Sphaeroforma arctica JP610 TaxID=667725 RepID=A0A0L0FH46_9EUKA|nr:hypothetical protein SARC_11677 [Sphaeroforma arctica JP610]KNC75806.1 hypothetical protein SARC_11677 [Sphaeroforma arctica JP610]|eukprot:XP_014149708.1 hypothetical protein SARC_11677 [Sphaeroforma arctica JP610]